MMTMRDAEVAAPAAGMGVGVGVLAAPAGVVLPLKMVEVKVGIPAPTKAVFKPPLVAAVTTWLATMVGSVWAAVPIIWAFTWKPATRRRVGAQEKLVT